MQQDSENVAQWLRLIQAEYLEMPGLNLTRPQVKRLWGLDEQLCETVLDALINTRFLTRNQRQAYVLAAGIRH